MGYRQLSTEQCDDIATCPSVWVADTDPDHVVIVGKAIPAGTVPTSPGEMAVRPRRSTVIDAGSK